MTTPTEPPSNPPPGEQPGGGWGQQPPGAPDVGTPPAGAPWGAPPAGGAWGPPAAPPPPGYWGPPPAPPSPGYWGPPSQLSPAEERTWAMFAHIGALIAGVVAMAFLGPLIVMLAQGNKSPFVRRHAVESLNFQLTLLIALVGGVVLSIVTIGIGLLLFIPGVIIGAIAAVVLVIIAGIKANNGEDFRYPLTIRLVK